jgi:segregation and condensation protein B
MQSRLAEEILEVGEVLLIASSEPLTQAKLNQSLERDDISIDELVKQLQSRFTEQERPVEIHAVAGGYQLVTRAEFKPYLQRLFRRSGKLILSRAALETLAIVAYRQPTTRAEVDQIRGVSSESVLRTLLEKNLVTIKGRDEGVGRPLLYATTAAFLEAFGLDRLGDLPKMKEIDEILTEGEKPSVAEYEVE